MADLFFGDKPAAATLPLVDRLFGTLYLPDHFPAVYGIDKPVPPTLHDELVRPFAPPRRRIDQPENASPAPASDG